MCQDPFRPISIWESLLFSFYSRTGMSTGLSTEEEKMAADMAAGMAPLIKNTNLESMKMIKEGILIAINELTRHKNLTDIFLKEKDVINAIDNGFKNQVDVYKGAEEGTLVGDEKSLEQVHKITEDIWAKAKTTPLPTNDELDAINIQAGRKPFSYNNNNTTIGGMYSSRKLKKSRKPKHK